MSDIPKFDIEVEVRKYEYRERAFEVGDAVEFRYIDVSSDTEQVARGAVVGYWDGQPVVLDDEWSRTRTGTHRRLFRLHPDEGEVYVIDSRYVSEHPDGDGKLALAEKYRASDANPRDTADEWHMGWQKRGTDLGKFRFGVELDDPSKPETRFSGVVVTLG